MDAKAPRESTYPLVAVHDGVQTVLGCCVERKAQDVPLREARGCVLAEDLEGECTVMSRVRMSLV